MNKRKNSTKRSFVMSLVSVFVCVAMLIGTTFAWFTDTVTSGKNKIVAGNLDVELEYYDGTGWKPVTNDTELFDSGALWEPGHTEVAYLHIKNAGTLDFKYKMNVNIYKEIGSINVNGDAFKLSDYLVFGTVDMQNANAFYEKTEAGREAARNAVGTSMGFSAWTEAGNLLAEHGETPAGEQYFALVIYIPTNVGNDANYKTDEEAPQIEMGVNVVATQLDSEEDSFGSDYDKLADGTPDNAAAWTMPAFRAVVDVPEDYTSNGMTITKYENDNDSGQMLAEVSIPKNAGLEGTDKVVLSVIPDDIPAGVTVASNEQAFSYEITLKKISSDNTESDIASIDAPVDVDIYVGEGLSGVKIFHTSNETTEQVSGVVYNSDTGIASFKATSFSPYTVVYNTEVTGSLPDNATLVYTLEELENAVENLHDGDYIAFGANIVQDKVETTSGQITFARAEGVTGDVEATLNLNGYVFDGQIGGFSFANEGLTVNVYGTDKVSAEYYEHETGHHMVKACAVFQYSGKTVLKSGLFESNNAVIMAYGGNYVIDGGIFQNTEDSDGAVCISACNDPIIDINGGKFECGTNGAVFVVEPYRTDAGPVITINNGTFDSSKGECFLYVDGDDGNIGQVIINGGTFTIGEFADWVKNENGSLSAGSDRIVIMGGSFNVDPSYYVPSGYKAVESNGIWTVSAN